MDTLEAKQQLEYIQQIIKQNRENVKDRGTNYIFWGVLIAISMAVNYAAVTWHFSQYLGIYWIGAIAIGWIGSIILGKRGCASNRSYNYAEKVLSAVWIGMGASATLVGFTPMILQIFDAPIKLPYMFICPLIAIILGMAFFATGAIMQFKWMYWVALGWWLGAVLLFLMADSAVSFLIFGVMILLLQVVPGIIIGRITA